jgi:hypothetical protein
VPGQVEQGVHVCDGHLRRPRGWFGDLISRLDLALIEHPEVEAWSVVGDEQRRNLGIVHANPYAVAGNASLCHLEDGTANLITVANAYLVVAQSLHSEVLAELSLDEVVSAKLAFPIPTRVDLINEHRTLLATMTGQIALTVTLNVESATRRGPETGSLKTPVKTVFPCQDTSFGKPTFTYNNVPADRAAGCTNWTGFDGTSFVIPGSEAAVTLG